jgi:hypothetical protein
MPRNYVDEMAMVCHDMMKAGHSVGGVSDAEMKEFEADCFEEEPETADKSKSPIKADHYSHVTA